MVLAVQLQSQRVLVSMKYESLPEPPPDEGRLQLGIMHPSKMPTSYATTLEAESFDLTYDRLLEKSTDLLNEDGLTALASDLGLSFKAGQSSVFTLLSKDFPPESSSTELRKKQTSAMALGFVSRGVKNYNAGRHQKALRYLNNAITIDRENVEALVARGTFFANLGQFREAVADFEAGLALNPEHKCVKKYLCQTLAVVARRHIDDRDFAFALASLQRVLKIDPESVEGKEGYKALHKKFQGSQTVQQRQVVFLSCQILQTKPY